MAASSLAELSKIRSRDARDEGAREPVCSCVVKQSVADGHRGDDRRGVDIGEGEVVVPS